MALKSGILAREFLPSSITADQILKNFASKQIISDGDANALYAWCIDFFFKKARESDRIFCFHTGPVMGAQDFRIVSPEHIMPWAIEYPDVKIDLYHMGIPNAGKACFIAASFPNVILNLCWAHVVAPGLVTNVLDEYFDQLPMNKIIGFGGDYSGCVENVYGALEIARENISKALTRRIERGLLDLNEAKFIMKRIFVENGEEWYGLSGRSVK